MINPVAPSKTVVLGIGNVLLSDEGVGVHAVRYLQAKHFDLPGVEFVDGGTLSFGLAGAIEDAHCLIVIDAAEFSGTPGQVRVFVDEEMDRFLGSHARRSVHEVGLIDLMAIARLSGRLPERRAIIGVQPHTVDWGELPTGKVRAAIPVACSLAMELIEKWRE